MNRRQFLGRFFQSIITLYNDDTPFGMYHSWNQNNKISCNLSINLVYRYNDESTREITSFMRNDLILAAYDDSGNMIKCSAYRNGENIINDLRYGFSLNVLPGTYTIKCLQLGKGLAFGSSGKSLTITVPDTDRTTLVNNNYGYITAPTLYAIFEFNATGLFLEPESSIETVGYMYPAATAQRRTLSPPSFVKCKEVYESAYPNAEYTQEMYLNDVLRKCLPPLDTNYLSKQGPVYYVHHKLNIKNMVSYANEENVAQIDLANFLGYGKSVELANICAANNIEYTPELVDQIYGIATSYEQKTLSGSIGTDGSYETYYWWHKDHLNDDLTIKGILANNSEIYTGSTTGDFFMNPTISSVQSYIQYSTPKITINGNTYTGTRMGWINVIVTCDGDQWMLNDKLSSSDYSYNELEQRFNTYESAKELYDAELPILKKTFNTLYSKYFAKAMQNYGNNPGDGSPWVSVKDSAYSKESSYILPLDCIFGHLSSDKSLERLEKIPGQGDYSIWVTDGGVDWDYDLSETELRPMLEGYTTDLSSYDPDHKCNDSTMWLYINNKSVFLKQTPTPINLDEIPDHRIG